MRVGKGLVVRLPVKKKWCGVEGDCRDCMECYVSGCVFVSVCRVSFEGLWGEDSPHPNPYQKRG